MAKETGMLPLANTIVFANRKGGVGKTTSSANVGVCLARRGYRTLLIDLDGQHNLTSSLGLAGGGHPTLAHLYNDPELELERAAVASPVQDGLSVLCASSDLVQLEKALSADATEGGFFLREVIGDGSAWDYVIVDAPGAFDMLTSNALVAARYVIAPSYPDAFSFRGIEKVMSVTNGLRHRGLNSEIEFLGVLLCAVARAGRHDLKITREVRDAITANDLPLLPVEIPRSQRVIESTGYDEPVCVTYPDSPAAIAYDRLSKHLAEVGVTAIGAAA